MRTDRLLLQDILDLIAEVVDAAPPTEAEFNACKFVQSHVLRHIQIIGEAAWRLSGAVKDQDTAIPWKKIAGMRHVLVHDYFEVNWTRGLSNRAPCSAAQTTNRVHPCLPAFRNGVRPTAERHDGTHFETCG